MCGTFRKAKYYIPRLTYSPLKYGSAVLLLSLIPSCMTAGKVFLHWVLYISHCPRRTHHRTQVHSTKMGKPPPASPSPAPLDMNAFDRETQKLVKNSERMARVASTLDIVVRVLTVLMESVPMSLIPADNK